MTNLDADLEVRLQRFLRQRMEASGRPASAPVLPIQSAARRRLRWVVFGGGMLAIAAVAVTLLLTLTPQRPSTGLTRSVVTAPGHIKIEALAASSGRLTSDRVPNWVVAVATAQKWAITNPSGQPAGQVTGLEVTAGYYVADATLVKIFDEGQYQTPNQPQDVWVVVIEAPPQSGFSAISGNAVINAATRQVVESDFFATLAPKSGPGPSESP